MAFGGTAGVCTLLEQPAITATVKKLAKTMLTCCVRDSVPLCEIFSPIQRLDRSAGGDGVWAAERIGVVGVGIDPQGVEHRGGNVPGPIPLCHRLGAKSI